MDNERKQLFFTTNIFFNFIITYKKSKTKQSYILEFLSRVYKLADQKLACTEGTLSTNATNLKKGNDPLTHFFGFDSSIDKHNFEDDIISNKPKSLDIMKKLVDEIIDPTQYKELVNLMLRFIELDTTIEDEDEFYLFEIRTYVSKTVFCSLNNYNIESFLLSVWNYLIIKRYDQINNHSFEFSRNKACGSENKNDRSINVYRYSENNKALNDEYSNFMKKEAIDEKEGELESKENKLSGSMTYFEEDEQSYRSSDNDFNLLHDFRNDYNKLLEFIMTLDFCSAKLKHFLRFDFRDFQHRVQNLKTKWDKAVYDLTETKNQELINNIKLELLNYVDIIGLRMKKDGIDDFDPEGLISIRNRVENYYHQLNYNVITLDNLNNCW